MSENEQPQTSDKLLLNLINTENEATIEREQIDFGLPDVLAGAGGAEDPNTRTEVIAVPDAPWNKSVRVDYHRRDLQRYFGADGVEVSVPKGATKEDIVSKINAEYGTMLAHLEMSITPAPSAANIPGIFTLKALPTSLGYIGEVPVILDLTRSPLADRLTATDLNGFKYPNANTPSLNNVITTRDATADLAWAPGTVNSGLVDDRKSFNFISNGEVVGYLRNYNTTGGWDTTGGRGAVADANGAYALRTTTGSHSNFGYSKAWAISFGFHLTAEQTKFQDALEGYDIEVEITSTRSDGSAPRVITGVVEYMPNDPSRLRMVNKVDGAVLGNITNNGSGKTTRKFFNFGGGHALVPGLQSTTTNVNGSNITIYRGRIQVKLTITRKTGRAKVVELITNAIAS